MRIPMARPSLTSQELEAVGRVFDSGWLGEGQWTTTFEARLAVFTGSPHVVAVNTGTSALHLALAALDIGAGDEVIVPTLTFVSGPMAVHLCGATPVFADIDPETLNLDPADVARKMTARTRAILPTDYAGLPADVASLRRIGGDVRIIRDAAHSFGSEVDGRVLGAWSGEDATCFSFDPIKNLTCGEGGAVAVSDDRLAARLREMRTLGFRADARSRSTGSAVRVRGVVSSGFRYHLSNINAAIGLTQLERFTDLAERRRALASRYDALLSGCTVIRRFHRDWTAQVPFIYPVLVPPSSRDCLIARCAERGIHADLRYPLCHQEPLFGAPPSLPIAETVAESLICLPLFPDLTTAEQDEVIAVFLEDGALRT